MHNIRKEQMKIHLKRLNQRGFDHIIVLVIFVVIIGIIGSVLLFLSHAATSYVEVHLGSPGGTCLGGANMLPCSATLANDLWVPLTGSNFHIQNEAGQCLDDWNGAMGTGPSNRVLMRTNSCYSGDADQEWNWSGSRLVNVKSRGCINSLSGDEGVGAQLIIYTCNSQNNELWYESSVSTGSGSSNNGGGGTGSGSNSGGTGTTQGSGSTSTRNTAAACSGTTNQKFICRAEQWGGLYYDYGGGPHGDGAYTAYKASCETKGVPKKISSCDMDCSGFISVVVDDVLGTNYGWIADDEEMSGGSWTQVADSTDTAGAEPGDIAVSDGHVEFVLARSRSGAITTYGEHRLGTFVSAVAGSAYNPPAPFKIYRWE